MRDDFLENLPVEPRVRESLRGLGYENPAALYGAIQASREAFETHYGKAVVRELEQALRASKGEDPMDYLLLPSTDRYRLGALENDPSKVGLTETFDLSTRDRLFDELTELEGRQPKTPDIERRIEELTGRITELVESGRSS